MTDLRLPRMLTLRAWEAELSGASGLLDGGLLLDFSKVEFADFGALARALLLIDAASRQGAPVTVTLPARYVTAGEERMTERYAATHHMDAEQARREFVRRARFRGMALAFMRHVGFLGALHGRNLPPGTVQVVSESAGGPADEADLMGGPTVTEPQTGPSRARRLLSFRWITLLPDKRPRAAEAIATGLADLGLPHGDARALGQTAVAGLLANAAERGSPDRPFALVGAILHPADVFAQRSQGIHTALEEIADYARENDGWVLRLIVADAAPELIGDTAESILRTFDEPSAVAGRTGSLWRVNQVVRGFQGDVLVRSGDALAGRLHSPVAQGSHLTETKLGLLPGSLTELVVPAAPHVSAPAPTWDDFLPDDEGRLLWVNAPLDLRDGLADRDRRELERQARAADDDMAVVGVVTAVPAAGDPDRLNVGEAEPAMRAVLDATSRLGGPATMITIFPDADPRLLELCVAGFDGEPAAGDDGGPRGPVLVLGGYGPAHWCGGTPPLRAVLSALGEAGGRLEVLAALSVWRGAGGDPEDWWRVVREHPRLLGVRDDRLELLLSPRLVYLGLEENANAVLARTIDEAGAGVERIRVRGRALWVTNRFIDVDAMLTGTIGISMAAFALARKVETRLREAGPAMAVAEVASAGPGLVRRLSECLALGGRYYRTPGEYDIGELEVDERIPQGASVVLCTDQVVTENTVRRAAATIAGGGARPLIIACVLDARAARGAVELLNHTVPVVSLVSANLDPGPADADAPVVDLDPLMMRPTVPVPPPATPVSEDEFLGWCTDVPGALRLGHIERPPNRHFSAFIRPSLLLRHRSTREKIVNAILDAAAQAFADVGLAELPGSAEQPWEIWHVGSGESDAGGLAAAVQYELAARRAHSRPPVPVPRGVAGGAWAFPTALRENGGARPVLVLDWASVSGGTMLHLTRLAARCGATAVVAISLIDQLDPPDAEVLRMLRSITGRDGRSVPVAMRFVTRTSIGPLTAHNCAICAAKARYGLDSPAIPEPLREHAGQIRGMMRLRGPGELAPDAATDLFADPIGNEDVVDYLRWRGLLVRARRDLPARQEVIDRLGALDRRPSVDREPWGLPGLIRLVAAEQQWLKLPPLRFANARQLMCDTCVHGLERATTDSTWLRLQILIVLSVAAPERIAGLLPALLKAVVNEPVLVDQLFLDVCRLIHRPPTDSPVDKEKIRQSLHDARDDLERRGFPDENWRQDRLSMISELIGIVHYHGRPAPRTAQAAWDYLRDDLVKPVRDHVLNAELLAVRSFVGNLPEQSPTDESKAKVLKNWAQCKEHLVSHALAYLPALREIVAGKYAALRLGAQQQPRLLRAIDAGAAAFGDIDELLAQLVKEPWQPGEPYWNEIRDRLLQRLDWWNRMFLATHVDGGEHPALLVGLIEAAPTWMSLVETVLHDRVEKAVTHRPEPGDVKVFCPEGLLRGLIDQLLDNIEQHRVPDAECRVELTLDRPDATSARFVLRNTAAQPSGRPGRGLLSYAENLRPFGGGLSYGPDETERTFTVTVTLPVWEGA